MKVHQVLVKQSADLASGLARLAQVQPGLILVFGAVAYFDTSQLADSLTAAFPEAVLLGCSTAGEISSTGVEEGGCILTGVQLDNTPLQLAATRLQGMDDSFAAGQRLGQQLAQPDLRAVLIFGPGVSINGSALVNGLTQVIGSGVAITGGLAGDGGAFQKTYTLGPDGVTDDGVVAVGFTGSQIQVAHGSYGGWQAFGPARKVTRCVGNVLYELDGEPALAVYKRYLGEHAQGLPASGLLFPFAMLGEDHNAVGLIRTILGIDEAAGSLTLAGEIQDQGYLKLMHASTDRLVSGAEAAAAATVDMLAEKDLQPDAGLAILVSCVGRKLVMGSRVDEEVEAVGDVLGSRTTLAGFYSYGEICPRSSGEDCKLHNQTMTITYLHEA